MGTIIRILKLAEKLYDNDDIESLDKLCIYFNSFIKKYSYFIPNENNQVPSFWKKNLDYESYEKSPYYGKVSDFLKEFPGGIKDWLEWKKGKKAHYVPVGGDDVAKFKSIKDFLEEYRKDGQSADDSALSAIKDMINYWKILLKSKKRRKK